MSTPLSIVVVAQEFPYPPNHGGRADVWRRLRAFKALGARIALVCWYDDGVNAPAANEIAAVNAVVDALVAVPKRGGGRRALVRLGRIACGTPSHAAARVMDDSVFTAAISQIGTFGPNAVWLDSPYGGVFAARLCKQMKLPMFYRSHNIEHTYFLGQASAATSMRDKLAWYVACVNLKSFEKRMYEQAVISFDISADDLLFWKAEGLSNGAWLPPLPEVALEKPLLATRALEARELAFLGNLHTPNNVRGLVWFVKEVLPIICASRPQTIFTIAGSRPNDITRQLANNPAIRLVENVNNVPEFLEGSRVLVNPVLTGSGVNVKTLDMLMTDRPIVSTPQGVTGLTGEIQALCAVATSPEEFAAKVLTALNEPKVDLAARAAGRMAFSLESVKTALQIMSVKVATQ
jgi:hypothetical protein